MTSRLVMLAGQHDSTNIVANELRKRFGDFPLIMERGVPRLHIVCRRARKLGYLNAAGQVLFIGTAEKWLRLQSKDRIEEIKRENGLDSTPVTSNVIRVSSANSDQLGPLNGNGFA